jgi:hypothetical protein
VYPHWLATLTTSTTLPLEPASGVAVPLRAGMVKSYTLDAANALAERNRRAAKTIFIPRSAIRPRSLARQQSRKIIEVGAL